MKEISSCEVCSNHELTSVMNLGDLPIPDDLVPIGETRVVAKYPTEILFCDRCKTAHQRWELPPKLVFHPDYHYRATNTKDVLTGLSQLVDAVEKHGLVKNLKVLDVGCNDGCLLDVFRSRGALTYGIEPTKAAEDAAAKGHAIDNAFLDFPEAYRYVKTYGSPDIITFTNVFAHIENLTNLIAALKIIRKPETRIVIENHYLGSVLDRGQFDTFYHEHLRTYSYTSFLYIAYSMGMTVEWVEFPKRYGGNIRVFMRPDLPAGGFAQMHDGRPAYSQAEEDFGDRLQNLNYRVQQWRINKRALLAAEIGLNGPMPVAAFPGRAAMLFTLLGFDERHLSAIYEVPISKKIGHYAPGTRIPILSDETFPYDTYTGPVLNTAWHIADEIEERWRSKGFKGFFIQAIEPGDFV